jgi:hypothetical protein
VTGDARKLSYKVAALVVGAGVASSHCGSRSGVLDVSVRDAGTEAAPTDPCLAPQLDVVCAGALASAPAGSEVWSTSLDIGTDNLIGPAAADPSGNTYYLAAESSLYVNKVFAVDACGALRWETSVESLLQGTRYIPQVMVVDGRLLLVGVGSITALELATGDHAFTADIDGFAKKGGLGVSPGKVQALGYTAARSDGTVFTAVANDLDVWIVSFDKQGTIKPVVNVPKYLSSFSYSLGAQQFVIDAAGHLVLAGGASSSGKLVRAFTAAGGAAFEVELPNWGGGRSLAGGPDFLTGDGAWLIDLNGTLRNENPTAAGKYVSWSGPTAVDAEGSLFLGGGEADPLSSGLSYHVLGSFSSSGAPRWRTALDETIFSGPILGDGGQLFVVTAESFDPGSSQHLVAVALNNGAELWRVALPEVGERPPSWLLLNDAGALIVTRQNQVRAFSSGGAKSPRCAWWPTPHGGPDQRVAAFGK